MRYWRTLFLLVVTLAVCGAGAYIGYTYVWMPISDSLVLSHADPTMVALTQEAGMSRRGELVFLRAQPQLVSDSQMSTLCAQNTAANNSNGFIEQGCYVPTTNRIYLRHMPGNLHSLTVSTASYEMLHPVYLALHHGSQGTALDQAIEANFAAINDANLRSQVSNFAKTEPGARDLELFSLLGTGYSNLTPALSRYYAPYFTNLGATVASNQHVIQLFQSDQAQLAQLDVQIKRYDTLASVAYATSVRWAESGNQSEDDYYYHLYGQYLGQENTYITQYNQLLESYNALVTEYDGTQPVQQINPAQQQSQ